VVLSAHPDGRQQGAGLRQGGALRSAAAHMQVERRALGHFFGEPAFCRVSSEACGARGRTVAGLAGLSQLSYQKLVVSFIKPSTTKSGCEHHLERFRLLEGWRNELTGRGGGKEWWVKSKKLMLYGVPRMSPPPGPAMCSRDGVVVL